MNTLVLGRRLTYVCAIVALLVPLYFLGKPSVRERDGSVIDEGGTLSQLRTHYDLGQSDLGELDPASESMRLATLGLRGVAATILWQKAEYYKREKYWDRLSATLNQIAILQPHFVKVWEFQAHNLSYNVSVEFDDYRQRYEWVKKGMNYLVQGSKFNKKRTEMPYELGWSFGNKLGVADERFQFRELFRNDENFHREVYERTALDMTQPAAQGPDSKPDNWRCGTLWYDRAYEMVDAGSRPAKSVMMFYRMGPQWDLKHAEAIQDDGYLDTPARVAWERAGKSWNAFGQRQIRTTYGDTIYLNELEVANQEYSRLQSEFEEFCGETYDRLLNERIAQLTPEQLAAMEKDEADRTFNELLLVENAAVTLAQNPIDIAKATPETIRLKALELANQLALAKEKISHIEVYRNQINYPYWAARCIAEQEDDALLARTSMYEANELLDKGMLKEALEKFEVAFQSWSDLFNGHPTMMIDEAADNVLESIKRYQRYNDQADLPDDFPLKDFMEFRRIRDDDLADPAMMSVIAQWPKRYPNRNFLEEMLKKSEDFAEAVKEFEESGGTEPTLAPVPEAAPGNEAENSTTPTVEPAGTEALTPPPVINPPAMVEESVAVKDSDAATKEVVAEQDPSLQVESPEEGSAPGPQPN